MSKNYTVATVCLVLGASAVVGQPAAKQSDLGVYAIPYASALNTIELDVVNSTKIAMKDVGVSVGSTPSWFTVGEASVALGALTAGETRTAVFTFDLDEKAPVGEIADLVFDVESEEGILQRHSIRIQPEAPTDLTLRGNYPNPFNPTTRIAYALPKDGNVEIEVFSAIGQRVTRLVDRIQTAGYQEATWNAAGYPSGVYFYGVTLRGEGARQTSFGKMVLMK